MTSMRPLPRAILAFAALLCLPARGQAVRFLQNDSFPDSGAFPCYTGITGNDDGLAARLTADPSFYPYRIDRVRVLVCGGTTDTYYLTLWQDNAGTANPGPVFYLDQNGYQFIATVPAFIDIDLSQLQPPLMVTSGSLRAQISLFSLFGTPVGFGLDLDGLTATRNTLYRAGGGGGWRFAEVEGVTGDFVLRLGVIPRDLLFQDGFG
jgi:hypothetical protein